MKNENIEKSVADRLKVLDEIQIQKPDLQDIARLVAKEKAAYAKRQNGQFAVFIAVSFFIVAALTACFFTNTVFYTVLQIAPFSVFCFAVFRSRKSEARRLW